MSWVPVTFRSWATVGVAGDIDVVGAWDVQGVGRLDGDAAAGQGVVPTVSATWAPRSPGSAGGPVVVVYPDETWYTYVDQADLDEIVDEHLKGGRKVERLLLAPHIGR